MWWSPLRFINVSLIKYIQEFIAVPGNGISYICWEVFWLIFFIITLLLWANHCGKPLYCNFTCKSPSTLLDCTIFGNLVSSSKTKWKYNTYILIAYILIAYIIAYIFHVAVNISLQNVIHTTLNVLLLANLFFRQNESTAYLTRHFS